MATLDPIAHAGAAPPSRTSVPSTPPTPAQDPRGDADATDDPRRIGRILVEDGLITQDQLSKALRVQARLEAPRTLAAVLLDLGWVSKARLEAVLKRHRRELSVEGILVEKGLLTVDQLAAAQDAVTGTPGKTPGRHLVEIGALTERAFLEAYCEKHDLPFVEVDLSIVDPEVLKKVSLRYLSKHRLLPLSLKEGKVNVLVQSLDQPEVLAEVARLFGCPVSPCIGQGSKIAEAIAALAGEADAGGGIARQGAIHYHRIVESAEQGKAAGEIVDHILVKALRDGASDVHVEPMQSKLRVRFRVDGGMVHVTDYPASYAASIISRIKVLAQADIAEHRVHQDGRIYIRLGGEEVDLRASFYVTVFGENAVLRILRKTKALVGLEQMGFAKATLKAFTEDALEPSSGIVLVTGPTGSGKTTTLYAAVERLNDESKKIITCEDPVEYVLDGITQCSVANRAGISFGDSLRAIVRQDPDIILIGEIRDRESADIAIQSALTGHKVLSTFHTEDSVGALVRLSEMDIEPFLVASTITAVLAQRLVRRQCVHCRVDCTPTSTEVRALSLPREELASYPLTRGRGCPHCLYTGYRGRIGVYELLVMHDELREAIMLRKPAHELRRLAFATPGFVSLQEDGIAKALLGETTLAEVAENCPRSKIVRPLGQLLELHQ